MKKICCVIGSRANYSSIKSALIAIKEHKDLELELIANTSALIDKFGNVANLIQQDGFEIKYKMYNLIEGDNPLTMVKSTALAMSELPNFFEIIKPDLVITVGDRYETMATAISASYMNITLAHTMGGEVSGTIDESIRHSITKLSHLHFAASKDAANRIIKLGEKKENVFNVGCPRIDLVKSYLEKNKTPIQFIKEGVGKTLNLLESFVLVSFHPVTTEYGQSGNQMLTILESIDMLKINALVLWPNSDAGSDEISKGIRKFRENNSLNYFQFIKNLPIDIYINLMSRTKCLVGNSSSGIREGAFIGTPVVNIGSRQSKRERSKNVIDVKSFDVELIKNAIQKQIKHGPYESNELYGLGNSGMQIANIISKTNLSPQKSITY